MEALGRFELPTCGLGNRRSIHLSYRAKTSSFFPTVLGVLRLRSGFRQRARTPANRLNLGNRRSIHLSCRAKTCSFFPTVLGVLRLRSGFRLPTLALPLRGIAHAVKTPQFRKPSLYPSELQGHVHTLYLRPREAASPDLVLRFLSSF